MAYKKKRRKRSEPKPASPSLSLEKRRILSRDALTVFGLCLLVAVSFFPATMAGFVWDDEAFTKAEPVLKLSGIWEIWFSPSSLKDEGHYWPVVYTTLWLEHKLWGLNPVGYHTVNLLLHSANTLLLWRILLRLKSPGALFAAALFAAHPLHVESVAWVIGRKDLLSGLFYMASALLYIRFTEDSGDGKMYLRSLGLFVLALLSKSIAVTLPLSLLLWHWWKYNRVTSTDLMRALPFFLAGLLFVVADSSYYKGKEVVPLDYSLIERVIIASRALWFYAGKLVLPTNLAVIYPLWDVSAANPLNWAYPIAAVSAAALAWVCRDRTGRGVFALTLFFATTLLPVLGFINYGYMQFSFVADRYQYLAGIGVIVMIAGAAARCAARLPGAYKKPVSAVAAVSVLALLGTVSWVHSGIYKDPGVFFKHIISLNPHARAAHGNLGSWHFKRGRYEEALAAYIAAGDKDPEDMDIRRAIGATLDKMGRLEEAEETYRDTLRIKPRSKETLNQLGKLLDKKGKYKEAVKLHKTAIETDPAYANGYVDMGVSLFHLNRHEEALESFERALSLNPPVKIAKIARENRDAVLQAMGKTNTQSPSHENIGDWHRNRGEYKKSLAAYDLALKREPDSAQILNKKGVSLAALGRAEEAEKYYRLALKAEPDFAHAINNLALLLTATMRYKEALKLYHDALEADPLYVNAHIGMGVALFRTSSYEEALESFERALSLDPSQELAEKNRDLLLKVLEENREKTP